MVKLATTTTRSCITGDPVPEPGDEVEVEVNREPAQVGQPPVRQQLPNVIMFVNLPQSRPGWG